MKPLASMDFKWLLVALFVGMLLTLAPAGCSTPSPKVDSNTNWLRACDMDAECGSELSCLCGLCTRACARDADCSDGGAVCGGGENSTKARQCGSLGPGGESAATPDPICLPVELHEFAPLSWSPPTLDTPETLEIPENGGELQLNSNTDYVLTSRTPVDGPLRITGGRNVILSGLELSAEFSKEISDSETEADRRLLSIEGVDGIFHLEGATLHGPGAAEGIFIDAPDGVIQIENVRLDGVRAAPSESESSSPSMLRTVRAVEIRVDGFSGSTAAGGIIFEPAEDSAIGSVRLQRVDIRSTDPEARVFQFEDADAYTLVDCYAELSDDHSGGLGLAVWPDVETQSPLTCSVRENAKGREVASWPDIVTPPLDGKIVRGVPEGGTFVPAAAVGLNYEPPDYEPVAP